MIEVTIADLVNSNESLTKLSQIKGPGINARVSYKISRTVKAIAKEIDEFFTFRKDLITENQVETLTESGEKVLTIPEEKVTELDQQLKDLLEADVKIQVDKIKLSFIENGIGLDPLDFLKLDYLIEDDTA